MVEVVGSIHLIIFHWLLTSFSFIHISFVFLCFWCIILWWRLLNFYFVHIWVMLLLHFFDCSVLRVSGKLDFVCMFSSGKFKISVKAFPADVLVLGSLVLQPSQWFRYWMKWILRTNKKTTILSLKIASLYCCSGSNLVKTEFL